MRSILSLVTVAAVMAAMAAFGAAPAMAQGGRLPRRRLPQLAEAEVITPSGMSRVPRMGLLLLKKAVGGTFSSEP